MIFIIFRTIFIFVLCFINQTSIFLNSLYRILINRGLVFHRKIASLYRKLNIKLFFLLLLLHFSLLTVVTNSGFFFNAFCLFLFSEIQHSSLEVVILINLQVLVLKTFLLQLMLFKQLTQWLRKCEKISMNDAVLTTVNVSSFISKRKFYVLYLFILFFFPSCISSLLRINRSKSVPVFNWMIQVNISKYNNSNNHLSG